MTRISIGTSVPAAGALFAGAFLAAAGCGTTFMLARHFEALGGSEVDAGAVLAAAALGTVLGVPFAVRQAARFGAARCAAIGAWLVALAFALLAASGEAGAAALAGGLLLGLGWGAFYLAALMVLSRLVMDDARAYWFLRFGAFQIAGIGLSPVMGEIAVVRLGLGTSAFFAAVAAVAAARSRAPTSPPIPPRSCLPAGCWSRRSRGGPPMSRSPLYSQSW